jgi:nitronate monooxygenase
VWANNVLTNRLKLDVPIVQGPFGSGLSSVDLVVAVSESGGLGSFGAHHLDGAESVTSRRASANALRARLL